MIHVKTITMEEIQNEHIRTAAVVACIESGLMSPEEIRDLIGKRVQDEVAEWMAVEKSVNGDQYDNMSELSEKAGKETADYIQSIKDNG